ncbi:hypothetical protein A2U01_0035487 [Trifolium medium]|uniref:Uncharacterized protein n=1 Tax=Trifolium medium TaxID=97028 RepID=A0A392PST2_9FABA|nr:hypothetical protein [Trifolium medium]
MLVNADWSTGQQSSSLSEVKASFAARIHHLKNMKARLASTHARLAREPENRVKNPSGFTSKPFKTPI